jgi:predicted cupin superfamily sugar epimerase
VKQTVVPGFEYSDHDFLTREKFGELVTEEERKELEWLVRKE